MNKAIINDEIVIAYDVLKKSGTLNLNSSTKWTAE